MTEVKDSGTLRSAVWLWMGCPAMLSGFLEKFLISMCCPLASERLGPSAALPKNRLVSGSSWAITGSKKLALSRTIQS